MKCEPFIKILGGITAVKGVQAAGVACGIKKAGLDLALIASTPPAATAGVFTTNHVKAAPVLLCKRKLHMGRLSALVANSGNANACTGRQGEEDARAMARITAEALRIPEDEVYVASTGVIGQPLDMEKVAWGIRHAASLLRPDGGPDAARAIMTTDAFPKEAAVAYEHGGKRVTVGGMAKGAGMIRPRMATMLAFLATDASVEKNPLQEALRHSVDHSFNLITVDGDTSTNDTVILFANGVSGTAPLKSGEDMERFQMALNHVTMTLARAIVSDGEGATKLVEVRVEGARTPEEARQVAFSVANSLLVKTAFFGEDPNWGRVMAAIGASGVELRPEAIDIYFDEVKIVERGVGLGREQELEAARVMRGRVFRLEIHLGQGRASAQVLTTDLNYDYVKINASYRS
ncbi:MAG: bifunctional glutamate N-acetyltransferase/amino-acid acetyltransferase ArgJ [candidate division NC10 bacterium]|nr:bifunctional glutamate N-acetyltransferase/amino-acid acetyltransferase ArgJ [candidate division NC10 bacterium]